MVIALEQEVMNQINSQKSSVKMQVFQIKMLSCSRHKNLK